MNRARVPGHAGIVLGVLAAAALLGMARADQPDDYAHRAFELTSTSANFPSNGETLYHALIDAGRGGHLLASASLTGLFSSTPP